MKPTFNTLKSNYYSSEPSSNNYKSASDVYNEVGYDIENLIKQNSGYANTCATRMSIALIKSGVIFNGRLIIKTGRYKNRKIETGAKLLADQLLSNQFFGNPEMIDPVKGSALIGNRRGLIFFWKITGYEGGAY